MKKPHGPAQRPENPFWQLRRALLRLLPYSVPFDPVDVPDPLGPLGEIALFFLGPNGRRFGGSWEGIQKIKHTQRFVRWIKVVFASNVWGLWWCFFISDQFGFILKNIMVNYVHGWQTWGPDALLEGMAQVVVTNSMFDDMSLWRKYSVVWMFRLSGTRYRVWA